MMDLDVRADMKKTMRHLTDVQQKKVPVATSRAINRAVSKVRTETRRDVSRRMGVQQKHIKGSFAIRRASRYVLSGVLTSRGRPIKLIYFKGTRQLKAGVKSSAYGKSRTHPGTFIANVGAGHRGAFRRKGSGRLPIKELYGPSVPETMAEKIIQDSMGRTGRQVFRKEFRRQLTRVLK